MGSLNASGIQIAAKRNHTYRKRDILITQANSPDDTVVNLVTTAPIRAIGSGSIVRDDGVTGTVEYFEELVVGVTRMARTCLERIASDTGCLRQTVVTLLPGSGTLAVIELSLQPNTPQITHRHTGETIVESQSVDDTIIRRIPSSGVHDSK